MLNPPQPPTPSVPVREQDNVLYGSPVPASRRAIWVASLTKDEARTLRHIGLRLRAARLRRRMTRAELAIAAGLNAAHVGTIERGGNNTTLLSLARLAEALGVQAIDLIEPIR